MATTEKLYNKRLFITTKKGRVRKHGNLRAAVFHPNKPQLLGFVVKRPDLLWMIKRKDRFVAVDGITTDEEGRLIADLQNPEIWDRQACKRFGVKFDECIIWVGMPVKNLEGKELDTVSDVAYDEETFMVTSIDVSENAVNKAILGSSTLSIDRVKGYKDGAIIVDATQKDIHLEGGVAGKAGEKWAETKHTVSENAKETAAAAGEAVDKGAYKTGEAIGQAKAKVEEKIGGDVGEKAAEAAKKASEAADKGVYAAGKQLGKASGMFKAFKDEFDKASK